MASGLDSAAVTAASTPRSGEGLGFHPERKRNMSFHEKTGPFLSYLNHISVTVKFNISMPFHVEIPFLEFCSKKIFDHCEKI